MIPFVDLKQQYEKIEGEVSEAIRQVLSQTNFILGEPVTRFEINFAGLCDAKYCVGVASGTDALFLALTALEVGQGDEVIIPANTFVATILAVSYTGATPVLVDVEEATFNIDFREIEKKITPRTKVIIPVHLYGRPVDMGKLLALAEKHDIKIIEDACQAHGATWNGKKVGSFGIMGCFSFYPGKNLGAYGDGGAIVTSDAELYEKLKMLRNYGSPKKYYHELIGYNSRLDTIQASILNVKLKYLPDWNAARFKNARLYNERLSGVAEVVTPSIPADHVFHLYVIRCKKRDELLKYLNDKGIQAGIHYPVPIYSLGAYASNGWEKEDFPVTEKISKEILSLPMFPELSEEQIWQVVGAIKSFYRGEDLTMSDMSKKTKDKIKIGLIGYGYWGPNLARNVSESNMCEFKYCSDLNQANLNKVKDKYPGTIVTDDYKEILKDVEVSAVIITTPTKTHYKIVKDCLKAKKNVFVEKPLCYTAKEAQELIDLAKQNNVKLMVGHTFLFNPAVHFIKRYIDSRQLGQLRHLHFQRRNLGPIRQDVNVMWDLAPHDISMALYFIDAQPVSVVASGEAYLQDNKGEKMYDIVSVSIKFANNVMANMIFSWIDPVKIRDLTIVGEQKMILFDDVNPTEKIKIYNKNANIIEKSRDVNFGEYQIAIHAGDVIVPSIDNKEPLKEEFNDFIRSIIEDKEPLSNGETGLAVVRIAAAIQESLDSNSAVIYL